MVQWNLTTKSVCNMFNKANEIPFLKITIFFHPTFYSYIFFALKTLEALQSSLTFRSSSKKSLQSIEFV